jgi:hypothetical protein
VPTPASNFQNDGTNVIINSGAVVPSAISAVALPVKGLASQSGDLQQWSNSTPSVIGGFTKDGYLYIGGTQPATQTEALLIDTNALGTTLTTGNPAVFVQDQNNNGRIGIRTAASSTQAEVQLQRGLGTLSSPSATSAGANTGLISFGGYDGSTWFTRGAYLAGVSFNQYSTSDHGTYLDINTTPAASTTVGLRARFGYGTNSNSGVGTSSPNVTWDINGGIAERPTTVTAGGSLTTSGSTSFVLASSSSGPITTITLAAASSFPGQRITIVKAASSGAVTIQRSGSDTLSGSTSVTINNLYTSRTYQSDGIGTWFLISSVGT